MFAQPPVVIVYIIDIQKYYHKKSTHFSLICYRMSVCDFELNIAFTCLISRVLHIVITNHQSIKNATVLVYRLDQVLSKPVKFPGIQRTLI
jgi:hypothetical protein